MLEPTKRSLLEPLEPLVEPLEEREPEELELEG